MKIAPNLPGGDFPLMVNANQQWDRQKAVGKKKGANLAICAPSIQILERETSLELATSTLARLRSTN